jgi:hypothetical protein
MSGHDGHSGANAVNMGNPGSHDTGEIGHGAHGHDHPAHGGPHSGVGKTIRGAVHMALHHGQKQRFSMRGVSHAQPEYPGVDSAAVDRITCPVTYQQSVACGTEPTRIFLTHVVNHGLFFHSQEFGKRARRMGLVRLDTRIPNMDGVKQESTSLMAWHAWAPSADPSDMPDGWKEGFTGKTILHREYWGIGKYDRKYGEVCYDRLARMILEVCWVVWRYDQTAVWETKQTIRVVPYWIYNETNHAYGFKIKEFEAHQMAAWRLSVAMFEALKAAQPDVAQTALINKYGTNEPRHDQGAYPGTLKDESELINEQLKEDRKKDLDTAKDSQGAIDGSFAPGTDGSPPLGSVDDDPGDPTSYAIGSGADLLNLFPDGMPEPEGEGDGGKGKGTVDVKVRIPKLKK